MSLIGYNWPLETAADPVPQAPVEGILAQALRPKQQGVGGFLKGAGSFLLEALTGVPSAAHRQQRQDRELEFFKQRSLLQDQLEQAKWERQRAWEAAHPKPTEHTTTQRTYEYLKTVRPDLADTYLQNQAQGAPIAVDSVDPISGDMKRQYVRPGQLGQPQGTPGLPQGYTVRPRGGAAPQASDPFPLRPLTR